LKSNFSNEKRERDARRKKSARVSLERERDEKKERKNKKRMDGSFLAVLFAVLISALGMENGIFLGVVLLFLYYPMRCVFGRFLEQFVTHFSAHFFLCKARALSLSLFFFFFFLFFRRNSLSLTSSLSLSLSFVVCDKKHLSLSERFS
jgi:hypothetical protein